MCESTNPAPSCEIDKKRGLGSLVGVSALSETLTKAGSGGLVTTIGGSGRDEALSLALSELAAGRLEALGEVWCLCGEDLYRLALWRTGSTVDAEDAVQEVFVRLARRRRRLAGIRRPLAYLLRMARNAAVDVALRRRQDPLPEEAPALVTEGSMDAAIDGRTATRLLLRLPGVQREVVFLRQFQGLTFREIGAVCGVSLSTAASRHRLAISRLRSLMGVEDGPR